MDLGETLCPVSVTNSANVKYMTSGAECNRIFAFAPGEVPDRMPDGHRDVTDGAVN